MEAQAQNVFSSETGFAPGADTREQQDAGFKQLYIVEDDAAVRSALRLLAASYGWKALAFGSGSEFLHVRLDEDDACLVLDLNMPKMDGEEVLRRLRARESRLAVLIITGDAPTARSERVRRAGAHEILLKPFGDLAFYRAVQRCWQRRGFGEPPT